MIRRRFAGALSTQLMLFTAGCGGSSVSSASADAAAADAADAAAADAAADGGTADADAADGGGTCPWLESGDGSSDGCSAARMVLSCEGPDAAVAECTSDEPAQCSGAVQFFNGSSSPSVSEAGFVCQNQCQPNEFGVVCGTGSPTEAAAPSEPPATCVIVSGFEGVSFYCCPCGS
ncbi:MAG: hypothetical protein ABSC94_05420 [Polyangiaceae bacterium]